MSRRAAHTQAELARIFKALKSAGSEDAHVRFDQDGAIVVTYGHKAAEQDREAVDARDGVIRRRIEARRHG